MFILFALLMLINYGTDKEKFLFAYRLDVFGMPINILDALIFIGAVMVAFNLDKREHATERTHRALKWVVGLVVVGALNGIFMAFVTGSNPREMALMGRNVLNLAVALLIGYSAVTNLRQAKSAGYLFLFASLASACATLVFMRDSAEEMATSAQHSSFNVLRSTNASGDMGMVCAAFLAFALVSGLRFVPRLIGLPVLLVTTMGAFALPHRSQYVAGAVTVGAGLFWLPAVGLGRRLGRGLMVAVVLGATLLGGAIVFSQISGRDFETYAKKRLESFLPSSQLRNENHPWETRLPAIVIELKMWMSSPIFGHGFGSQDAMYHEEALSGTGFRHNVWTASLAEGGLPLFLGYAVTCVLCVVVGRRLVRERFDVATVMIGAIAALHGVMALTYCSTTMYINHQRPAIPLGLICGLLLRVRQIQEAVAREYAGYLDDGAMYDADGHALPGLEGAHAPVQPALGY